MCDTKETIPPLYFHKDAKTCVFWDVDDYPILNGLDPASIYQSFKSAIEKHLGYQGEVTIHAYADKNTTTFSEGEFSDAGFEVEVVTEGGKNSRHVSMFADIMLWTMENPAPANVIVLAQIIDDENIMHHNLEALITYNRYGVLISEAKQEWGWEFPGGSGASFLTWMLAADPHSRSGSEHSCRWILLIPRTNFCKSQGRDVLSFWLPPYITLI